MKTQRDTKARTRRMVSLVLAVIASVFFLAASASAKTITVTGTGDTIALDGKVTLREAMIAANQNIASGDAPAGEAGFDTIKFNIPGGAFQTITLTSSLPAITNDPTVIDGTSQPGYAGTPVIELNGNNVANTGLFLQAGSCMVKGLMINRFKGNGIVLTGKGLNFIVGNYIGTNASGTVALGNEQDGVSIQGSSSANSIGGSGAFGNVISGNGGNGIGISGGSDNNTVQGNYIGTNAAGTASLGNGGSGVRSFGSNNVIGGVSAGVRNVISGNDRGVSLEGAGATGDQVQGNLIGTNAAGTAALGNDQDGVAIFGNGHLIGGTLAAAKNVISGNRFGVGVGGSNNQVQGNFIGTNPGGTAALGNSENGVSISGSNNLIGGTASGAGNLISGNVSNGVTVFGGNPTGNKIEGNLIGTDVTGTSALANDGYGVRIISASNNTVGGTTAAARNIISGNGRGLSIETVAATGNAVQGNYIGLDRAGTAKLTNKGSGVELAGVGNTIGGTSAGAGNVISGNKFDGVTVTGVTSTGNKIQGNLIGTDATGTFALGNSGEGVRVIDASKTVIGGNVPNARNIISGNNRGLTFEDASTGNLVLGNYIGTDLTGSNGLGNSEEGVMLLSCSGNLIGGTVKGSRNVISGNASDGVRIGGPNATMNLVQGNFIGTKADGVTPLPNSGAGIDVFGGFNNTFGGTVAGAGNVIAGNGYAGALIQVGNGNALLGNSIVNNARLGINLNRHDPFGLIANDPADPDSGANKHQNYPLLTSVTVNGGNTSIQGTLNSVPNKQFRVEFFANKACSDSGFGQGQVFIGATSVTTDANGDSAINATLPLAPAGQFITATATSPGGDTSEFSPCALVGGPNPGIVQFLSGFFLTSETDGTATITVTRSSGMLGTITVHYATSNGAATAPADYASTSGDLTFGDGEVIKTFTVPVVNDGVPEPQETLNLTLSAPTGGASLGSNATSKLFINDADPKNPGTGFSDAGVVEGNSGTAKAVFHITVTQHAAVLNVGYGTEDGSAQAGLDYQATSGTLTFNPGETSKDVTVSVIGDTLVEGDEVFFLYITDLSAGYVERAPGEGLIIDDEGSATLSLSAATYSVNENGGSIDVLVKRVGGSTPVTVDYATSDASANAGSDYTPKSGTLSFAADETEKVAIIPIVNDAQNEPDETFNFKLGNTVNAGLGGPNTAAITIHDDDVAAPTPTPTPDPTPTPTPEPTPTPIPTPTPTPDPAPTPDPVPTPDPIPTPTPAPGSPVVQFSAVNYSAQESSNITTITVTRTGDATQPATVDYETSDGTASERSDYTTALGTLRFAAGETSKTFDVLLTDDAYIEADEQVQLRLTNPTGNLSLGQQTAATLTIKSEVQEASTNPIDDAQSFVRQHYHDFLNREPDASGLAFWTNEIAQCGALEACANSKRESVSAAFFLSIEFQETGFLVTRLNLASYAKMPRYREFLNDTQEIGRGIIVGQGQWEQQLETSKATFADRWVARTEFTSIFGAMSDSQYVDALFANAGVQPTQGERDALINGLQNQTETRATVLRKVVEHGGVVAKAYSPSFVLMQYVGYLRRNPDDLPDSNMDGYQFWLQKLQQFGGDYNKSQMVKAFIVSTEYREHFGQ